MSFILHKAILAAVAALALSVGVQARSLEDKEKASLAATVTEFNSAMAAKNFDRLAETVPPKILASLGAKAQVPVEDVRKAMMDVIKMTFAQVIVDSFSMDFAGAEYKVLANGTPYALIPTETVILVPEQGKVSNKSHSLALLDEGKWYLVRVSEAAQLMILKDVYPEFAGVEFPQGSMEILKK